MSKELKVVEKSNEGIEDNTKKAWFYSDIVKNHFLKPRNFLRNDSEIKKYDGYGVVDDISCGDRMDIWIKIDGKKDKIIDCKWRTWGCASALASTSMLSVMLKENGGMKIEDALKIKPIDIIQKLGGLPKIKYHCSVLGDRALRSAIYNYFKRTNQISRIKEGQ